MVKKIVLIVTSAIVVWLFVVNVFNKTPDSDLSVDHVADKNEKIFEKLIFVSKIGAKNKLEYQRILLQKRFAELKYAIKKDVNLIETSSSRYVTYVSLTGQMAMKYDNKNENSLVYSDLQKYQKEIEEMQKDFKYESGWWLSIQHAINASKDQMGLVKS